MITPDRNTARAYAPPEEKGEASTAALPEMRLTLAGHNNPVLALLEFVTRAYGSFMSIDAASFLGAAVEFEGWSPQGEGFIVDVRSVPELCRIVGGRLELKDGIVTLVRTNT